MQSDINVKKMSSFGNCGESEKRKLFTFSAPNDLPNLFKYCNRALNHPVFVSPANHHSTKAPYHSLLNVRQARAVSTIGTGLGLDS
jgi:hypothetical protein